ncbi:MAG: helix-turn-helix domain-containing protein [Bacteroides sp.]|nr:helix-turn-helix domain-containing protein [Bacteroides sp.]
MKINEIIKRRRLLLRITQQDLAELSGVSLRTIKDIESGAGNPSLHILSKIADILGMEVSLQVKDKINEAGGSIYK